MGVPLGRYRGVAGAMALLSAWAMSGCDGDASRVIDGNPPPPAAVAKVVIEPGSVLLTETGQTRTLVAHAFDASGMEIAGRTVSWSSAAPANLTVSQAGVLRAEVANGSTQITATIDGVVSRPLLAVVTRPAAGASVLDDSDILGEVGETATNGPAGTPGNSLEFVLADGVGVPAVGSTIVGSGDKPVAGRVVEAVTTAGRTVVRFTPGPLLEVFPELVINEVFQLGPDDVEINPDIAASYDVVRDGSRLDFTPKPATGSGPDGSVAGKLPSRAPVGTYALPPFGECEWEGPSFDEVPLSLSLPPVFSLDFEPQVEIVRSASDRIDRWLVTGPAEFAVEAGLGVKFAFEGTLTCKAELVTLRVPVGGPLSLLVGGLIPVGVGFKMSGELTVAQLEAKTKVSNKANVELGLACPADEGCSIVRELNDSQFELEPELILPGGTTGMDQLRLALGAQLFGYAEVEFGSPLFERLRLEALDAKAGAGLEGEFAPRFTQVSDTSFKAHYSGKGFVGVEAGTELTGLAARLGIDEITFLELGLDFPFAASPTGWVRADRARFLAGDEVAFTVQFDAETLEFIPGVGPFNLRELVLLRSVPGGVEEIARTPAVAGQAEYTFDVVAPALGRADEYFAFLDTALVPPFDLFLLEVGNAAAVEVLPETATVAPGGTVDFNATVFALSDASVSWDLPDGGGTIDANGLFTAGSQAGTYAVRATSVADPAVTAEATVTITEDSGGGGTSPPSAPVRIGRLEARASVERNCQPNPAIDRDPDSGYAQGVESVSASAAVPDGGSASISGQVTGYDAAAPGGPTGTGMTVSASGSFAPCTSGSVSGTSTTLYWTFSVGGTESVGYSVAAQLSSGSQSDIQLRTDYTTGEPVYYFKSTTLETGSPSGVLAPGNYQVRVQMGDTLSNNEDIGESFSHTSTFSISFSQLP